MVSIGTAVGGLLAAGIVIGTLKPLTRRKKKRKMKRRRQRALFKIC